MKIIKQTDTTWDELIKQRKETIGSLAEYMDVNEKYLCYNSEFMRAVLLDNKYLAISSINKAAERYKELTA